MGQMGHRRRPITVLEELDRFKKGNEDINFQARQFLRTLDELTGDIISESGAPLGPQLGSIRVVLGGQMRESLKSILSHDSPDHRILNTALELKQHEAPRPVVLITKDTNLRMKAKAVGLTAQDYSNDKVESFDKLYTGTRLVEGVDSELVDQFYAGDGAVTPDVERLPIVDPIANENFIIRNGSKSVLATFGSHDGCYHRVEKLATYGISPRNAEQAFALKALLNDNIKLVTLAGKAGSGKTLLALAAALELRQRYRQILLARPIVPLSNRDIGYLPGDVAAKLDPYMQPLYDALNDFLPAKQVQKLMEEKRIEIAPLAFMRGRTLSNAFVVLDEAQNATTMQMKMFLTRLGEGSRMVVTGDRTQVDLPRGTASGLVDAERILDGVRGVSFNYFTAKDVVRHPLVARIIEAYDRDDGAAG